MDLVEKGCGEKLGKVLREKIYIILEKLFSYTHTHTTVLLYLSSNSPETKFKDPDTQK